jgi:hypothetical protein
MGSKKGKVAAPPRLYFRRYVAGLQMPPGSDTRLLPLTHGTSAVFLRDILAEGRLRLPQQPCETLKERLIFTFYGRPSYVRSETTSAMTRPTGAPIYILLKPSALAQAAMAHPLDTGAFKQDLYDGHIDRAFQAADFGFEPSEEMLLKVVFHFFGSNTSYMEFKPRQPNIEAGEHEALAYLDVINSRDAARIDVRDSSIEIGLRDEIEITPATVQCVILPDVLMDSPHYGPLIKGKGIDVRAYRFTPPIDSAGHAGRILDCVVTYYREKGLL